MTSVVELAAALVVLAGAPSVGIDLRVERDAGASDCPDQASLSATLEELRRSSDRDGGIAALPDVHADVSFSRSDAGYRATLRLRGAKEGERTLTDTGSSCVALGRAVAITLALSLESEPARPPAPPLDAPSRRTDGTIGLTAGGAFGLVGSAAPTAGAVLSVSVGRRLWLHVGGDYVASRSFPLAPGSVRVSLSAARLGACGVLAGADGPLDLSLCLEGAAGVLRGEGLGYARPTTEGSAWLAAGAGARARHRLGRRWRVELALDALAPLRQDTFSVENRGVAYRSDAVSWAARLGVAARLW